MSEQITYSFKVQVKNGPSITVTNALDLDAYDSNACYEVHSPSGTGKALGTSFHVRVLPGSLSRFSVDDGAVAVIHLDVTVVVVAGQLTTVPIWRSSISNPCWQWTQVTLSMGTPCI